MEENSRLKKIIDLYVEKGLDNTYLYDEMIKAFSNASPEEQKEGHEYLNRKLQETKSQGRHLKKEYSKKYKWIIGLLIVIFISIVIAIIAISGDDKDKTNYSNTYTNNSNKSTNTYINNSDKSTNTYTNSSRNTNSNSSTTTHYCEASGCMEKGTYSINGTSGKKEYYCYKHYKQMEDWAKMLMGY